jgi:hypothetical protein
VINSAPSTPQNNSQPGNNKLRPKGFYNCDFNGQPTPVSDIGANIMAKYELGDGQRDSVPIRDHGGKLKLGSQLAVSFKNIREHNSGSPSKLS